MIAFPDFEPVTPVVGRLFARSGNSAPGYQRARETPTNLIKRAAMEGFLASHPTDPHVCSKLEHCMFKLGSLHRGIELLERGLALVARMLLLCMKLHLGIAYTRLQHPNLAIAHYQAAIQIAIYPKLNWSLQ